MRDIKIIILFLLVLTYSCTLSKTGKDCKKKSNDLYKSMTFLEFNKATFVGELKHYIDNKIDVFDREGFFKFMTCNSNFCYDDFYFIELNISGEYTRNFKILVVNYQNRVEYYYFLKNEGKWIENECPSYFKKLYTYSSLNKLANKLITNQNEITFVYHFK